MMRTKYLFMIITACMALLYGCKPMVENTTQVATLPKMYPDYTEVTIPKNIAPLNFLLRDQPEAIAVRINGADFDAWDGSKATFDIKQWRDLLTTNAGKTLNVEVSAQYDGAWKTFKAFHWYVANDTIDHTLTYRLIEPDYEIWNHVTIEQRDITSFETSPIANHEMQENRCMNCHAFSNQDPDLSMVYVRGKDGGAILNDHGTLRKLNIKAHNDRDSMVSSSVYYGFSPSGRYITFSTNVIIPAFHARANKRLEVYDKASDVYVADLKNNIIYHSPLLADSAHLETFPTFSPDGKYVYYCVADANGLLTDNLKGLQYSLVRIPFNEKTGCIGNKVDTLFHAGTGKDATEKRSVCHPRISPDGRYIVYTVASYGTFPIWHPEADLQLMDLATGRIDSMAMANSDKSDTYHSWSSNSRWLIFASKRGDGVYGKPYFCYIDRNGHAHKPFVLPQADPSFYDNNLKSFNVPELGRGSVPFDPIDVERVMKQTAEPFTLKDF